jgi:hypothetical protein
LRLTILVVVVLFLTSCTNQSDEYRHDSIEHSKDSLQNIADRKDKQKKCCFQTADEFTQFLPDTLSGFTKHNTESLLPCTDDTLAHNSARAEYIDERGHMLVIRITEYCPAPFMLASDYSLKYEMHKSTAEFNEFDVPPTHHGFATYDKSKSTAYLLVEVDERFLVEITDQVCDNTKSVVKVFESLPLDKLAEYAH